MIEIAGRAADLGIDWIQVREKDLAGGPLLELVSEIRNRAASGRILVNDRLDVALAAGAAGVHLGAEGLPVAAVRRWRDERAPGALLVGRSCHGLDEARAAESDGADYVFFGPVFATPSKLAYGPPQGTTRLAEVCSALAIPVIAIGGITPERVEPCMAAGAWGVAVLGGVWRTDPVAAVTSYLDAVDRAMGADGPGAGRVDGEAAVSGEEMRSREAQ